jgi:hypothetical protein
VQFRGPRQTSNSSATSTPLTNLLERIARLPAGALGMKNTSNLPGSTQAQSVGRPLFRLGFTNKFFGPTPSKPDSSRFAFSDRLCPNHGSKWAFSSLPFAFKIAKRMGFGISLCRLHWFSGQSGAIVSKRGARLAVGDSVYFSFSWFLRYRSSVVHHC